MKLTPAQRAVARHFLGGYAVANIAAILGISENTARCHIREIFKKSHTQTSTEFAMKAIRSERMLREVMEVA